MFDARKKEETYVCEKAYLCCRAPSHVEHRVSQRKYKPATKTYAATSLSLYRKGISLQRMRVSLVFSLFRFCLFYTVCTIRSSANVLAGVEENGNVVVVVDHIRANLENCHITSIESTWKKYVYSQWLNRRETRHARKIVCMHATEFLRLVTKERFSPCTF